MRSLGPGKGRQLPSRTGDVLRTLEGVQRRSQGSWGTLEGVQRCSRLASEAKEAGLFSKTALSMTQFFTKFVH